MKKNIKSKRKVPVFIVVLVILLIIELISAWVLNEWESKLKYNSCMISVTQAKWIPAESEEDFGRLFVTIENCGSVLRRNIPEVYFGGDDSKAIYNAHIEPMSYYNKVNSDNVKNYSIYECIPPGEEITIEYHLEERDAVELEALLMNEEKIYVMLPKSISQKSSKCILELVGSKNKGGKTNDNTRKTK